MVEVTRRAPEAGPADRPARPVVEAFAEHAPAVERLLRADVEFARLCEDFDEVVTAYRRAASGELPPGVADEYHSLRLELEGEILEWVRCGSNPVGAGS